MEKITVSDLAKQLNVSHQALYNRIKRGTLKAFKVDGTWYVDQTECERVLQGSETVSNDSKPLENDGGTLFDEADKSCDTCEQWKQWEEKHQLIIEQNEYLKKRIDWLEGQIERQTILLANEQAQRMKVLPHPFGWVRKLFERCSNA